MTVVEQRRTTITVHLLADPELLTPLRWTFGAQLVTIDPQPKIDKAGRERLAVTVQAHSEISFAAQIAGFGLRVEVIEAPEGVFDELARLAGELHGRYVESNG